METTIGHIKGDTRSLDYSSYKEDYIRSCRREYQTPARICRVEARISQIGSIYYYPDPGGAKT